MSQLGNASEEDDMELSSQKSCEYIELIKDKEFKFRGGFKRQNVVTLKYFLDKRPAHKYRERTGAYDRCLPYSLIVYTILLLVTALLVHFHYNGETGGTS
jgi:hypothetical protein